MSRFRNFNLLVGVDLFAGRVNWRGREKDDDFPFFHRACLKQLARRRQVAYNRGSRPLFIVESG